MAVQKQDDQHEHTFSSYVRIQDVVLKTYLGRWTIERSGERGSGISVLPARYDDDDDVTEYLSSVFTYTILWFPDILDLNMRWGRKGSRLILWFPVNLSLNTRWDQKVSRLILWFPVNLGLNTKFKKCYNLIFKALFPCFFIERRENSWLMDGWMDFYGSSIRLGVFNALTLENCVHCTFIFIFLYRYFSWVFFIFCTKSHRIRLFFKQIYLIQSNLTGTTTPG